MDGILINLMFVCLVGWFGVGIGGVWYGEGECGLYEFKFVLVFRFFFFVLVLGWSWKILWYMFGGYWFEMGFVIEFIR